MTFYSSSSQSFQDLEDEDREIFETDETSKYENTDSHNDVNKFGSITRDLDEERENVPQKLPVVIEQFDDNIAVESTSLQDKNIDSMLRERIKLIGDTMKSLRQEFQKELSLLKKEKEEFDFLKDENDCQVLEEARAAARAATIAYAAESPVFNEFEDIHSNLTNNQNRRDLTILGIEKCVVPQQNTISFSSTENNNYNKHQKMLAKAYKQKLAEVEKLCNEELETLKQNAYCLQPLKDIALQWDHGDSMLQLGMKSTTKNHSFSEHRNEFYVHRGIETYDIGDVWNTTET